jgi:aldose 1-epimerase
MVFIYNQKKGIFTMTKYLTSLTAVLLFLLTISCQSKNSEQTMIEKELFGKLGTGEEVYSFTLSNKAGMKAKIINYGAILVSLTAPDKNGKLEDVVLGFDNLEGYMNDKSFIGSIVGRFGNRINKGKISLDGKEYQLVINDGENQLHGGPKGFYSVFWNAEPIENDSVQALKLTYHSPDGEEGYPGNLDIEVIYTLTNNNELQIDYAATTDKPTVINPTHHSYFCLSGNPENTILDEELKLDADYITPVNKTLIPTGKLMKVENTPFDFRTSRKIGERINNKNEQLDFGKGYDHNWVLNNYDGSVKKVGELFDPKSGRLMELYTDQPGMKFYSGNFINGTLKGKKGIIIITVQLYVWKPNIFRIHPINQVFHRQG